MAIFDDMAAILATVPVTLGHPITYATLTSNPAAQGGRTYTAFTGATALIQNRAFTEEYDADRNTYMKRERAELWTANTLAFSLGDLVRDQNAVEFGIGAKMPSGIGTNTYQIVRDLPMVAAPDRKGGV